MASVFNSKYFNSEVFGKYLETVPRVKQNAFLSAGIFRQRSDLKTMLNEQTGGNFISVPMVGLIGGDPVNYDGSTNITASGIDTYIQSMIVIGRAKAWEEKDFSFELTGHDFMAEIAKQVAAYWDDVDQGLVLSTLKGMFGVSTDSFTSRHTLDITGGSGSAAYVGATTLNSAVQKAAGANKGQFTMAIMHSVVATALENLGVLEYWKYTDSEGVQRPTDLKSWNGRAVLIDDDVPVQSGYYTATSSTEGALKVVAESATDGQVLLSTVQAASFYPTGVAANDYVVPGEKYETYILGKGAFDYCDCGAKVPVETQRDPSTSGGKDLLYTRQRKLFAPHGFSWVQPESPIMSPTNANLETAARWTIVNNGATTPTYYNTKALPFARIISRG